MKQQSAFFDTSAIVPLCFGEDATQACNALYEQFAMVVWWGAIVECHSAFNRLLRTGQMTGDTESHAALRRLEALRSEWIEVSPKARVRERSISLLKQYPLRAADALQLAAAVEWRSSSLQTATFISGDRALLASADKEGFEVRSTSGST